MNSKWFWLIIIAIVLTSAVFLWYNHTSTQKLFLQTQETIKETKKALYENNDALQKLKDIINNIEDIARLSEEAGDERVKEIKSISDDDFLDVANDYSALMVERVE